ncbi:hypothetical protein B296_00047358 [Ensete ventricosum]|uniref:Translation elongation factor EFTu-like domain-containing protein n=1 Tax=Ensete ventricosum TaxID=4639 RepID=A0A426YZV9_ENSVE|nr:hypothetical protein B296_00047358 [Ensete ventricosum]
MFAISYRTDVSISCRYDTYRVVPSISTHSTLRCRAVPSIPVGYLSASIRSVADARVGDTITHFGRRAASSLPGYEKATPMVFCGLFPVDADQ